MAPNSQTIPKKNSAKAGTTQSLELSHKLIQLTTSSELYWFSGHVVSLICFALWQLFGFFSKRKAQLFSRLTLIFQLVSYGIVIWKSVSLPKTGSMIQLLRNENVQYFLFAAVLLATSTSLGPWTKALTSFMLYSFFHSITYFQKNLLQYIPISLHTQAAISDRITYIAANFNLQALYFASLSELMLLIDIFLGVPGLIFSIFRYPGYVVFFVLRALAVVVFLKLRFDESQYTKASVQQLDAKIATVLNHPMAPPQLRVIYHVQIKSAISKYAGLVLVPRIASPKKTQ